jgi:hypothetical protein
MLESITNEDAVGKTAYSGHRERPDRRIVIT